jgi:hypothetical protein
VRKRLLTTVADVKSACLPGSGIAPLDERREGGGAASDERAARIGRHARELRVYLENNRAFLPNYGERYWNGETISTAFVESTVNQVVSRRMVKKQQMQWTPRGAHLLLQVRTRVLNDELAPTFREWYPQFQPEAAAAVPLAA